jgi:hypothetical protein
VRRSLYPTLPRTFRWRVPDGAVFGDGVFDPVAHANDKLLDGTDELRPAQGGPRRAQYPAGGYVTVPVDVRPATAPR